MENGKQWDNNGEKNITGTENRRGKRVKAFRNVEQTDENGEGERQNRMNDNIILGTNIEELCLNVCPLQHYSPVVPLQQSIFCERPFEVSA